MAAYVPRELHIGIDAEKVVVGPRPLRMRTGRALRRRLGSITEVVPVPPSGRSRADRNRFASQLGLALVIFSTVLSGLGFSWWAPAAGSAALVAFVVVRQTRAARTGFLAMPGRAESGRPREDSGRAREDSGARKDSARPRKESGRPGKESGRPREESGRVREDSGRVREDSGARKDSARPRKDPGRPRKDPGRPRKDPGRARAYSRTAGEDFYILYAEVERTAYARAVAVARRIRGTWPALAHMIDPAEADQSLVRALDDLAAIMARRQQIRRLRAELAEVNHQGLPADSPALQALAAQRGRVDRLWRETGETANRILAGLNAAALAGENLIREQRIGETARDAELAIARLSGPGHPMDAGPELAERTAAVIAAYRELAAGAIG
jgi:hypothetical protein